VAVFGAIDVSVGARLLIVKICGFELPPDGLNTVTFAVPAVRRSDAGTTAVNDDGEPYVLARAEPFQFTVDDAVKRAPVKVMVNCAAPVVVEFGEMEAMLGPVTETVAGTIAPARLIPIPDENPGWEVLKNPSVVDADGTPEIWEKRISCDAPIGRVDGTYAISVGNL